MKAGFFALDSQPSEKDGCFLRLSFISPEPVMVGGFREELAGAQFDLLRVLNHASRFADLHIHSIIGRFLARPELTLLSHLLHSLL
ncbi:hypothetical protein BHT95_18305 [Bacillus paralicheniformis]|nr:hypothetical protein BHT95_18305 [Bacillus paralicheniformis]